MSTRIAFASTDGTYIDQHFGSARIFHVFDLDGDSYTPLGARRTAALCRGNCEGGFEHLLQTLADCDAIFVGRIGPGAAAFMIRHGKRVFEAAGPVEDLIAQVIADDLLAAEE